ncbi:unnamed protein product [Effrenium voratum]|uniref:Uncharacterized protein n=1 Tax=Effrenium voratum TaxID=2562239 RepID=A0AA36NMA6_9DINO|nr:unnamed protein product [Effrenium voratum]
MAKPDGLHRIAFDFPRSTPAHVVMQHGASTSQGQPDKKLRAGQRLLHRAQCSGNLKRAASESGGQPADLRSTSTQRVAGNRARATDCSAPRILCRLSSHESPGTF